MHPLLMLSYFEARIPCEWSYNLIDPVPHFGPSCTLDVQCGNSVAGLLRHSKLWLRNHNLNDSKYQMLSVHHLIFSKWLVCVCNLMNLLSKSNTKYVIFTSHKCMADLSIGIWSLTSDRRVNMVNQVIYCTIVISAERSQWLVTLTKNKAKRLSVHRS